jgi:hypothetical protein
MNSFLNRKHAIEGSQTLAVVLSMLGVIFSALDLFRFGELRAVAASMLVAAGG